jgi:putative FmdB family regulatory protein
MPTYDFQCEGCGHTFEAFQSFSEKPLKKCPACGKQKLRRLIGAGAAVIFKGSGFYQTDYRSESYKSAAKADQEASKPATPAPAATTDAGGTNGTGGTAKEAKPKSGSKKASKSGE